MDTIYFSTTSMVAAETVAPLFAIVVAVVTTLSLAALGLRAWTRRKQRGKWHHLAMVHDEAGFKTYVDGVRVYDRALTSDEIGTIYAEKGPDGGFSICWEPKVA